MTRAQGTTKKTLKGSGRRVSIGPLAALAMGSFGCNSLDAPIPEDNSEFRLVIPTDVRPALSADRKPPPVTGGTVLVTRDGLMAVASDPERDSVVFVDIGAGAAVLGTVALQPGDEPANLVEDDSGRIHVALRRGGAVATLDRVGLRVVDRRAVCSAPRGITLAAPGTLVVACADGKLVTLPAAGGAPTRSVTLEPDLRDVVAVGGSLVVSRFKTAEVLRLDAEGAVLRRDRPSAVLGARQVPLPGQSDPLNQLTETRTDAFRPLVAWRTLAGFGGSLVVVHQRAVDAEVVLAPPSAQGSSYGGGGFSCSGISENAVTVINPSGAMANLTFSGAPLPVDATLLSDGNTLVVAHAGLPDPTAPRPFVLFEGDGEGSAPSSGGGGLGVGSLSVLSLPSVPSGGTPPAEDVVADDPGCQFVQSLQIEHPVVAVAHSPTKPRQIVVQTRQPSSLVIVDDIGVGGMRTVSFDDGTTLDTGFELFHRDSGGGIACASCHPEGSEDGNVWVFSDTGARRTQSLQSGLAKTAPFHWDGKLPSVGAIMSEVFVGRMGGVYQSAARLETLRSWLFALAPPAPIRASDDAAVLRGRDLFQATDCASCHSGESLSNNRNANVGTGEALQVPSLLGVGYRAPFMHSGCAKTLADRFDPSCGGGELHGRVRGLTPADVSDLVAYLESL